MTLPAAGLRIVEHVAESSIETAIELYGGLTSKVWRCELADRTAVVVKQVAPLTDADELVSGEVAALRALEGAATSTGVVPSLLGFDATERVIVMSAMEGDQVVAAEELRPRIGAMAQWLVELHDTEPVPSLRPWRRWGPDAARYPENSSRPELWAEYAEVWDAIEQTPWMDSPHRRLLHRDVHPLNVLWAGSSISAVVDWANACIGHPHADVAHLRWNLAVLVDINAADELVELYREAGGIDEGYDPMWDLQEVNSGGNAGPYLEIDNQAWLDAGRSDLDPRTVVDATERFVESALRRLR